MTSYHSADASETLEKLQPVGGVLSTAGTIVELGAVSPRLRVVFSARHAARCPRADTRSDRSILRTHVGVGAWTGPGPDRLRPHPGHWHRRHHPDLFPSQPEDRGPTFTGLTRAAPTMMPRTAPFCRPDMHSALPAHPLDECGGAHLSGCEHRCRSKQVQASITSAGERNVRYTTFARQTGGTPTR